MRILARSRARPWPERPVSEANKSGNGTAATPRSLTYLRSLQVMRTAPRRSGPATLASNMNFLKKS